MKHENLRSDDVEIVAKPWSDEDEMVNDDTASPLERGKHELALKGINLEEQRKYFEIMKRNDMPIGNAIFTVEKAIDIVGKSDLENRIFGAVEEWEEINKEYQKIDTQDQDENTGKEIIVEMKKLIVDFLEQLQIWQKNPKELPNELQGVLGKIKLCSQNFVKLPAFVAYRAVGMYELDSDRLKSAYSK
ncbi:MAG: hypothetical protein A2312_02040 [Candidatus Staskawiczbacteria bacterium RIFOXYB2_FULL_32_9]|uniref:Uncharacterized protein n=1 Tax=Candidatus Staskawiczbacteria bacterium RIFOXYD1_FULL_32_13 TaxID=1802234 RepID=A0A1G2JR99_9BACT|nr:MAG: hypothetical protein UR22_C0022G0003 [Parcubacteria group bacterium GW2011_GWC2_32_10]OGZ78620.1 MAG: hypothetical protein A2360_01085 [Candidatus Staskawiczbacteria bacterium RIFOXYB1_FULL_32_11]OGZ78820.1 MAG: hypothetical protein A2256_00600 [Candidatus Staskawiczbacteria bacterium RIFOXYA2_FULL_32_7]OGZ81062.1 MAG: hypothetical protein A2312_02040 [Candidatus Staskawiczbacteria bacterium RIFOXYB2_FULL_32_9]OGZ89677.1 MAG: hypothetical protein A2561_00560 [Candidatus Staskawiczbacter